MISLSTAANTKMTATSFAAERVNNSSAPVILIAEDNADSREMLKILLEMWNYRVIEAEDGEEAVRVAEKIRPDLILMDVRLPLLDGLDAARRYADLSKAAAFR